MRYCSECGSAVSRQLVAAEARERYACAVCGTIHYQNPRIIVCCIVHWCDKILMCRRAQEPALGQWTLPSGYLECGETLEEGAARETFEETGIVADPADLELYAISNMTAIEQIAVTFRLQIDAEPNLRAGAECREVAFLTEEQTHQNEIAWRESFGDGPRKFFQELRSRNFTIQLSTLASKDGDHFRSREYPIASASIRNSTRS